MSGHRPGRARAALASHASLALAIVAPLAHAESDIRIHVVAPAERDAPPGFRASRSSTFTKTDTPLREVPASVSVVTDALIRDAAMESLADVWRYVPGAGAHQGEGNRDQVVLRGISTTADFFVDGVRDDAQVFRDLYNVERVEVLKGPGGMAFGRGGAGGIVNRVLKRPASEPVRRVAIVAGSHDQWRGTLDLGDRFDRASAWRVNAVGEESGSFRDGVHLRRYGINPVVQVVAGATTTLLGAIEHLEDTRTADRGIPSRDGAPYATDASRFFGNAAQSRARSSYDAASVRLELAPGANATLASTLRATRYDKYYRNVYPGGAVDAQGNLPIAAYDNANDRSNVFSQTDLTWRATSGPVEHVVLAGVELGWQDSASRRNTGYFGNATTTVVPAADPYATATRFAPSASDADNVVRATAVAAYVQDQVRMPGGWGVLAGVRFDRFRVTLDDRRAADVDLARTDTAWSPRAALMHSPRADTTVYASYSYAFLPSGEQLGLATTTAALAPETATNVEIGIKADLSPSLAFTAAIFRLDRDDVRVADPLNAGFFTKTGRQRTDGVELSIVGDVTSRWSVFGGYAYLDARVLDAISTGTNAAASAVVPAGRKVGLVPRHAASVWNRFALAPSLDAGLGLVYRSSAYTSYTNAVRLPSFARVDAALGYTFPDRRTRIALNVENLLDRRYYPTADGDNNISPGTPRSVRLTLALDF